MSVRASRTTLTTGRSWEHPKITWEYLRRSAGRSDDLHLVDRRVTLGFAQAPY
jgi:hypothetical protein